MTEANPSGIEPSSQVEKGDVTPGPSLPLPQSASPPVIFVPKPGDRIMQPLELQPRRKYERLGEAPSFVTQQWIHHGHRENLLGENNGDEGDDMGQGRRRSRTNPGGRFCRFCRSNRETLVVQVSHETYRQGRVTCPILRGFVCTLCGGTGDFAHTRKYCPFDPTAAAHRYLNVRDAGGHTRTLKH